MNRQRGMQLYMVSIGCLTAAVLAALVFFATGLSGLTLISLAPVALFFVGLGWFSSRQQVYFGESNTVVLGTIAHVATILLLPYPVAVITIALSKALSLLSLRMQKKMRSWRAAVINLGATVLANAAGAGAFHLIPGHQLLWDHDRAFLAFPALLGLGLMYQTIDLLVVVGAISLSHHDPPWPVFRGAFRDLLVPHLSLIFIGIVFAVLWHFSPALVVFVSVPVYLSMRSFESVARLRKETVEAVLRMAEHIDYRDTNTYDHSQRLADFTKRLATELKLIPDHINEVILASRVHDLGKIGISNDVLFKQGALTPEERRAMEEHPVIGANILSSYSAFQSSVDIVRHHHERWDGKGYPDGLKGEEIPIGSRIIAVVDAFDAMTADRPYRKGMSVDAAVQRLKDGMGSQFDPRVCAAFLQMLIEEGVYMPPEPAPDLRIVAREAS